MYWTDPSLYGVTLPYKDVPFQTPFVPPYLSQWQNTPYTQWQNIPFNQFPTNPFTQTQNIPFNQFPTIPFTQLQNIPRFIPPTVGVGVPPTFGFNHPMGLQSSVHPGVMNPFVQSQMNLPFYGFCRQF